jgi:hypothetical protein
MGSSTSRHQHRHVLNTPVAPTTTHVPALVPYYTPPAHVPPNNSNFQRFKPMDKRNWALLRLPQTSSHSGTTRKPFVRNEGDSFCDIVIVHVNRYGYTHEQNSGLNYKLNAHMYGFFGIARAQEVVNFLMDRTNAVNCIYVTDKRGNIIVQSKTQWMQPHEIRKIVEAVKQKKPVVKLNQIKYDISFENDLGHYGINNQEPHNFLVTSTQHHIVIGLYAKKIEQGRVAVPTCGLASFLSDLGY